jgi:hypothetical protein
MRKLKFSLLFLGFALAGLALVPTVAPAQPVGPPNEIVCNKINNSSSGPTAGATVVAAVANQQISLCGFLATAGAAAGTFQLITGQGAACATQTATITPTIPLPINGNIVDHTGQAWVSLPTLGNLCVVITGTGPVSYNVYYAQF